jgi:hypothetical protein
VSSARFFLKCFHPHDETGKNYKLTHAVLSFGSGWVRGNVVGWGTTQQAGRSRVRFPMRSMDFFNWSNPSSRTITRVSIQPLTEMNTSNLPRGKGRPARRGWQPHRHLWADCLENVGVSTYHNPMGLHGLLQWQLQLLPSFEVRRSGVMDWRVS